jgi:primosomal protein N' (replication factor Y) (superfamily II helicase)
VTFPPAEQLSLVRSRLREAQARTAEPATTPVTKPIARVAVDVPLAHLDRLFDYTVPAALADMAVPGCRVRVRFAGRLVDGYLLHRLDESPHDARLSPLARVVSPEPVLTDEIARVARAVADRYAGTLADVLRLAIPPRHARVEAEPPASPPPEPTPRSIDLTGWQDYEHGDSFLAALRSGEPVRAVWTALSGADWPSLLAAATAATVATRRGVLIVVPDRRDVARVSAALEGHVPHVILTAEVGPAERYRRWLAVRRGQYRVVVGTRAAIFAPVENLGLLIVWDDGDDLHAEPRAPYPHVREVAALRASEAHAAVLIGGYARTADGANLVATGWARSLAASRSQMRRAAPLVRVTSDEDAVRDPAAHSARLPSLALDTARSALAHGPVLVQVPRRGYLPAIACATCRAAARCPACAGPLALPAGGATPACRWCGTQALDWRCPSCGGSRFRSRIVGARRTAEELGRAFPRIPVRTSGGDTVLDAVGPEPALVIATPGAEPQPAADGYAAALLLDTWALLARPDLRAGEEALRRWLAATALVRPGSAGGRVVILGESSAPPIQALVRTDPDGFADRELAERATLAFPPVARLAALEGAAPDVADLLAAATLPSTAQVLGPVGINVRGAEAAMSRSVVRVPRADGLALAAALHGAQGIRSARKSGGPVRVVIDPIALG